MKPFVSALRTALVNVEHQNLLAYLVTKCGEDLERVLAELDGITQLKSSTEIDAVYAGAHHNIHRLAGSLRTAIEYQIIQTYSVLPRADLLNLYSPVFDLIFSNIDPDKYCLPVFTTNYDPAIEEFCDSKPESYDLTDGFAQVGREYIWNADQFHAFKLKGGKRNVVLFKLHGSVDWLFVRAKGAIVRTQPFHQMIDEQRYKNVLIYPAVHKVATDEPYFTAYDYYGRCCERSKFLLTIGYSFRDYDALARLRSAMSFNSDLTLLLLAPDSKDIIDSLPLRREQVIPIEHNFGWPEAISALRDRLK